MDPYFQAPPRPPHPASRAVGFLPCTWATPVGAVLQAGETAERSAHHARKYTRTHTHTLSSACLLGTLCS